MQEPPQHQDSAPAHRPPVGPLETLLANCRPQPAIPAMLVLFLTLIVATLSQDPQVPADAPRSLFSLFIPAGIILSCGLAVAAGFCSFFPPAAWILVALWGLGLTDPGPLPAYNRYVLLAGLAVCTGMLALQFWRVLSGRFVPTVPVSPVPPDDPAG